MELSNEDNFRLNILLNQKAQAIRIDESKMIVFALTDKGEAKVKLNPNCRDEKYIKYVRELISSFVLGSPGGYPVFLGRWTRMGQTKNESLEQLLLLGEPEAVVAVVHASGISNEIARRAWWSMPTSENARRMLDKQTVVNGTMGGILAEYLIDYLPFEVEAAEMIESVRLVLQSELIDEQQRISLWSKAKRKSAYYVGFLLTQPEQIPEPLAAHPNEAKIKTLISTCSCNYKLEDDACIKMLLKIYSAKGQTFLNTINLALTKPINQDVVILLFTAINQYFSDVNPSSAGHQSILEINDYCHQTIEGLKNKNNAYTQIMEQSDEISNSLFSILFLSCLTEQLVNPIFSRSTAIGSVMRKKLQPVSEPILTNCKQLCAIL